MESETAVLISVRPKWCELIANGQKTLEVRKSRPKLEPPFTCYIYCTMGQYEGVKDIPTLETIKEWRGHIIGEFVCDDVSQLIHDRDFLSFNLPSRLDRYIRSKLAQSCLTAADLLDYSPLDLSMFRNLSGEPIRRVPQSWMYVGSTTKERWSTKTKE